MIALEEVVSNYEDVFAVRDSERTQTDLIKHDIDTGNSPPIKLKTRPVPMGAQRVQEYNTRAV